MKATFLVMLVLAVGFSLTSCANGSKTKASDGASILGKLSESNELDEESFDGLKDIADDSNSSLQETDASGPEIQFTLQDRLTNPESDLRAEAITLDPAQKWAANGMNPSSVNPGDIFSESVGPVLNKTLSLSDELSETERNATLSQIASHSSKRFPITLSQKEINTLRAEVPAGVTLPTRSVALDVKTQIRKIEPERFELFLEKLATGDSGGSISSIEQLKKRQAQLAEVKKRLKKGEDLFIVTAVTESEKIKAHYPGAPVSSRDAEPIRNAVQSLYPHLTKLNAEKENNRVVLTGSPRLLWEFEVKGLELVNENVVIKEVDGSELAVQ